MLEWFCSRFYINVNKLKLEIQIFKFVLLKGKNWKNSEKLTFKSLFSLFSKGLFNGREMKTFLKPFNILEKHRIKNQTEILMWTYTAEKQYINFIKE